MNAGARFPVSENPTATDGHRQPQQHQPAPIPRGGGLGDEDPGSWKREERQDAQRRAAFLGGLDPTLLEARLEERDVPDGDEVGDERREAEPEQQQAVAGQQARIDRWPSQRTRDGRPAAADPGKKAGQPEYDGRAKAMRERGDGPAMTSPIP